MKEERAILLFPCCLLIMLDVPKLCLLLKLLSGYLFIASAVLHTTSSSGVEDGTVFFLETVMSYWKQQYSNHFPQDCKHCTENKSRVIIIIRGRESLEYYNVSTFRGSLASGLLLFSWNWFSTVCFICERQQGKGGSNFYRGVVTCWVVLAFVALCTVSILSVQLW